MKTLIVTGGTGGLGATVVEHLSREYQCVLLRRPETDLADEASIRSALARAAEQFGAPYGLVHMAGGYVDGSVSQTSSETWLNMLGLNLTSAFLVIRETLALMHRDQPGRIVAISSEASTAKFGGAAAYTISKSGLNTLIELTALELRDTSITVNALLPGTLDTAASRKALPDVKRIPLHRVAETISYLLSDEASSINGALVPLR